MWRILILLLIMGMGALAYSESSVSTLHANLGKLLEWTYWQDVEKRAVVETAFKETLKEMNAALSALATEYDIYGNLYRLIPEEASIATCLKCIFSEIARALSSCYHVPECQETDYCPNPGKRAPGPEWLIFNQCCCNPFSKEYQESQLQAKPFATRFERLGQLLEEGKYEEAMKLISVLTNGIAWIRSYFEKNEERICRLTCVERDKTINFAFNLLQFAYTLLQDDALLVEQLSLENIRKQLSALLYKFWDTDYALALEYNRGYERFHESDYLGAINHYKRVILYNEQLLNVARNILSYIQSVALPSLSHLCDNLNKAIQNYQSSPYKEHAEKWVEGAECLAFKKKGDCWMLISYGNKLFEERNKALGELFDAICDIEDYLTSKCPDFRRHPWSHRR